MSYGNLNSDISDRDVLSRDETHAPKYGSPVSILVSALPGMSALAQAVRLAVKTALSHKGSVLFTGEAGTGKAYIARHALRGPGETVAEFDADHSGSFPWLQDVRAALSASRPVLLTHIDRLDEHSVLPIAALLAVTNSRFMATALDEAHVPSQILSHLPERIVVPALSERIEDVPVIAAAIVRGTRPDREKRLGPDARRLLWQYTWPGNITELEAVLRRASSRTPAGVVDACFIDLPRGGASQASRPSPLARAERAVLLDALRRCGGNKLAAADLLGIARSTLYRKLRALGVDDNHHDLAIRESA